MEKQIYCHWLTIAKKINSIAQTGLAVTKDDFDREAKNTRNFGFDIKITL